MDRMSVTSTNIRAVGYERSTAILEIEFHDGGVYQYYGVSADIYNSLLRAGSIGSFFHKFIKDGYRWTKVR